jgi:hypothetical protein
MPKKPVDVEINGYVVSAHDVVYAGTFERDHSIVRERATAVAVINKITADKVFIAPATLTVRTTAAAPLHDDPRWLDVGLYTNSVNKR